MSSEHKQLGCPHALRNDSIPKHSRHLLQSWIQSRWCFMVSLNPCSSALPRHALLLSHDQSVYEATKRNRVFQDSWLVSYSWLRYEKDDNVMLCGVWRFSQEHPALDSHGGYLGHARYMNAYKAKHCPQETPMAKIHRNWHHSSKTSLFVYSTLQTLKHFCSSYAICCAKEIYIFYENYKDIWYIDSIQCLCNYSDNHEWKI